MAASNTDTRVVQMEFDNSNFDPNIKKSQKTLEDFKKSLNFDDAASQMDDFIKSSKDLSTISTNLQKLADHFTGLGTISDYVLTKIKRTWQGALNTVEGFVKSLTSIQANVGFDKYSSMLKSVQTIKSATGDAEDYVYSVLEELNHYTDETSYSFSDMAQNISKFTTVGVGLKDAEKEMEGIANWAALSGQGINEASRAMYNISQAMSAGYMLKIDYKSIQNASMDTKRFREEAIKAGVAVGTLVEKSGKFFTAQGNKEVTESNFAETLSYKWFDKATMESVFKTFADNTEGIGKEAYAAAQRCVTFKDALDAIKDMLSSGWLHTYEYIFGELSDAINLFSGMCNKAEEALAKLMDFRNGVLSRWSSSGGRTSLWSMIVGELESPDGGTIYKGAYGLMDILIDVGDMLEGALRDFVRKFINPINYDKFDSDPEYVFDYLAVGLRALTGNLQEFVTGLNNFFHGIPEGATESRFEKIQHIVEVIFAAVSLVSDVLKGIGTFVGGVLSQLEPAFYMLVSMFSYISQLITGSVANISKNHTIVDWFQSLADALRPVTTAVNVVVGFVSQLVASVFSFLHSSGIVKMLADTFVALTSAIAQLIARVGTSDVFQSIAKGLATLLSYIPQAIAWIGKFVGSLGDMVKNSKLVTKFWPILKQTFSKQNMNTLWMLIKSKFAKIVKAIPTLIPSLLDALKSALGSVGDFFGNMLSGIVDFLIPKASAEGLSDEISEQIVSAVTPTDVAADVVKPIAESYNTVWDTVKGFFTNFFHNTIPAFWNSEVVVWLRNFITQTNWLSVMKSATGLISALAWFRGAGALGKFGKGFTSLGKGFKELAQSIKLGGLHGLVKDIVNFNDAFNDKSVTNTRNGASNWGQNLLMTAAAIGVLVVAVKKLAETPWETFLEGAKMLGILAGGLLAVGLVSLLFKKSGKNLLMVAAGIYIMVSVMQKLMGIEWIAENGGGLLDGLEKLAVILVLLAGVGRLAGNVKMSGFVALAIAVRLLIGPVKTLSKMKLGEIGKPGLATGLFALGVIFGLIAGLVAIAGTTKFSGLKGLLGLSLALTILLIPIKSLSKMPLIEEKTGNGLVKGIGALLTIMAGIGALIAISSGNKQIAKLGGLVAAIAALVAMAGLIGLMDPQAAIIGFGAIAVLLWSISSVVKSASKLHVNKLSKLKGVFISIGVIVGLVAVSIGILSSMNVPWEFVASFLGGISLMVLSVGSMMKLLEGVNIAHGLRAILLMGVGLAAFMTVVSWLLPMFTQSFMSSMATAGGYLEMFSGSISNFATRMSSVSEGSIQHAGDIIQSIYDMMVKVSAFSNISSTVKAFSKAMLDLRTGIEFFFYNEAAIPDPTLSNSFRFLNKILGMKELATFKMNSNLATDIFRLGVGIALFHRATSDIPLSSEEIPGLNIIQGLFGQTDNIERFSKLPLDTMIAQMSALGGAMQLYALGCDAVGGMVPELTPNAKSAVEILKAVMTAFNEEGDGLDFSGFELPENMPDETNMAMFGASLASIAAALGLFCTEANKYTYSTENAIAALRTLAGINSNLTQDDIAYAAALGSTNYKDQLSNFALNIGALGEALGAFAGETAGKEYKAGLDAMDVFAKLHEQLTSETLALLAEWGKDEYTDPLGNLAFNIGEVGTALATFASSLNWVDEEGNYDNNKKLDFDNAIRAVETLAAIDENLPEIGGLVGLIRGNRKNLTDLGAEIEGLGDAMNDLSNKLNGLPTSGDANETSEGSVGFLYSEKIENALSVLSELVELDTKLSNSGVGVDILDTKVGGLLQLIEGHHKGLGDLVPSIDDLGDGLRSFSKSVNGVSVDPNDGFNYSQKVKDALQVLNELVKIEGKLTPLPKLGGLESLIHGNAQTLTSLSGDVDAIGKALASFSTSLSGDYDAERVASAVSAVGDLVNIASKFAGTNEEVFGPWKFLNDLADFMYGLTDPGFYRGGRTVSQNIVEFAKDLTEGFAEFSDLNAVDSAVALFRSITEGIKNLVELQGAGEFTNIGLMISTGLAQGIRDGGSAVVNAAAAVVQAAIIRARRIAKIGSPSKVFAEMGAFMDAGLAQGIDERAPSVVSSIDAMTTDAVDKATTILAAINQAMAEEIDPNPTITPVLDLTNLTKGGRYIAGLFGDDYGLDVGTNTIRASRAAANSVSSGQNAVNLAPISKAIDGLRADMETIGNNIANLKIVLNTGVIAGGVTDDVDINLGRKALYANRRN